MTREQALALQSGDEVTWTDPDDGLCSRTGLLHSLEELNDEAARITFRDGWTCEMLFQELSCQKTHHHQSNHP